MTTVNPIFAAMINNDTWVIRRARGESIGHCRQCGQPVTSPDGGKTLVCGHLETCEIAQTAIALGDEVLGKTSR